jgi:hypothetical protein
MPLIQDPNAFPRSTLVELRKSLRNDLEETRELIDQPVGRVLDPASLETANELLRSTLARLDLLVPTDAPALAADINIAYATLLAVIDLVKSHTDVPKVPRRRSKN